MVDANLDVSDDCVTAFNQLKMDKTLKYVIFRIENQRTIVIDKAAPSSTSINQLVTDVCESEPRFIVLDMEYTNPDGLTLNKIIFIHWIPNSAKVAPKMVYASSKENLKRKFVGIFKEVQATDPGDLTAEGLQSSLRF